MSNKVHHLKCLPEHFEMVIKGMKPFEIRFNDRCYQVGDFLHLMEWNGDYTGREITKYVPYMTDYEQKPGYVVMTTV